MSEQGRSAEHIAKLRVALLTNSLSPHTLPLCEAISHQVEDLRAFVSADADRFHDFPKVSTSFLVTVQRALKLRLFRRDQGFWAGHELHIPYDTFQQLRSYRPDVILSNEFGIRTILSVLYRRTDPRVRLLLWATLSTHTEKNRAWYRRGVRRWIIRHTDAAFVNGSSGREYLRSIGFHGEVITVPYTIDDKLFRPSEYRATSGKMRLLYCGRISPVKGIRAFSEVLNNWCCVHPEQKVHLQLIGDGADAAPIRAIATASNLEISVVARMSQEALAGFYPKADVFVLPTLGDEWGVVVNEAMSAGLPVLGSIYSQAVTELIEEGCSGWIFDPLQENSTNAALDRALTSSPAALQRMSENARNQISLLSPLLVAQRAVQAMQSVARNEACAAGHHGSPRPPRTIANAR